ncbi:MAG: hypothetical protein GY742_11925 [Hyphomicrobiales bacterium]|nr:hypothetical protein [Hyphomicrobiales bacterium]
MARTTRRRRTPAAQMQAPKTGVNVRMYRQGHGDCFLLAFPRKGGGDPVYMMIDCGYKPGSQISDRVKATNVVKDIADATGKKLDVVAVTHEHQDHVNALTKFKDFDIGVAWFAWTEDPDDDDANELRRRHTDQLLGLIGARNQLHSLAAVDGNKNAESAQARLDQLLMLELGGEDEMSIVSGAWLTMGFGASSSSDPSKSQNKRAMEVIKASAKRRIEYILPHDDILEVPDAEGVRVFALGPPKNDDLLKDEDPKGDSSFPGHEIASAGSLSFFAAARERGTTAGEAGTPFAVEYGLAKDDALNPNPTGQDDPERLNRFFGDHYGRDDSDDDDDVIASNAKWRRIDEEWLYAAETFALKLNRGINNTSLVLAFELVQTGKVLLFVGDAQNGNWKSWDDGHWLEGEDKITAKNLLERTVLYKVGHHGSHNATLKGKHASNYPNLGWMGHGKYAKEFTALIPANRSWALKKAKWNHPLPAIKHALERKANGRVLQLDTGLPAKPDGVPDNEWKTFEARTKVTELYIEYHVPDEF